MSAFKYKVFISYSHTDEKWARWLHRGLESFRLPKQTRKDYPLRPVFRDRDELSAARDLSATIKEALAESESLIVVCSRAAAESIWVNAEVEEFIRLGRDNQIYCLIVDKPPVTDCYPSSLYQQQNIERLGADVHADGKRAAKLKLVAALLGVEFDTLAQRDKHQRRVKASQLMISSVVAVALVSLVTYRFAIEPPCTQSSNMFAQVWNPQRAGSIQSTFLSTSLPFRKHSVGFTIGVLDKYADQWINMHQETCEATMVRGEQSSELMDLRMACLSERREKFDALAQQLQVGDIGTVSNAVSASNKLGRLSRCADRQALLAAYPPPEDRLIEVVTEARKEIAQLKALVDSVVLDQASTLADALWEKVRDIQYAPIQAETLVLLGKVQALKGDPEQAHSTFLQAASKAVTANDNELAAEAWLNVPALVQQKVNGARDAQSMLALAKSYVDRLPPDHPLRASYAASLGEVLVIQGDIEGGLQSLEKAAALARASNDTYLPTYLNKLAIIHGQHLNFAAALPLVEESIELSSEYFGETHPQYARALQTMGGIYIDTGETAKAIELIAESLQIEQAVFPAIHAKLGATYAQLGSAYFRAVQVDQANTALLRSLSIYSQLDTVNPIALGDLHNNIGNLYSYLERFKESEHHLLEAARLWQSVDFYLYSIVLNNLGSMVMGMEDYAKAKQYCSDALAADERQFPPDSPNIAYPLSCLGEALFNLGEYESAITVLERAYTIRKAKHQSSVPMAHTRINLAMALWEVDGDREKIRAHYEYALSAVIEHGTGDEVELREWAKGKDI
jgi:tetratricopeptide (TPR) repeat protein